MTGPSSSMAPGLEAVRLIDVRQLADLLGVSVRAAWRFTAESDAGLRDFPKCLRISSKICRWRLSDVQGYVNRLAGDLT